MRTPTDTYREFILLTGPASGTNVNNRSQALGFLCSAASNNPVWSLCLCAGWPSHTSTHKPLCNPAWCYPLRFPAPSAPAPTWTTAPHTANTPRQPLSSSTHMPPPRRASLATATPPAPQPLPAQPPQPQLRPPSTPPSLLPPAQHRPSCTTPHSSTSSRIVCSERRRK